MKNEVASYALEELSAEVARLLAERGLLGAQPDPRVSAAPDARTVRYYTTLGLLDRPAIVGRTARYSERHLRQLLAIKALQVQGLPLAQIQERLFGRSEAELNRLVASLSQRAAHAQIEPRFAALHLREVAVVPGLRLVVEEGFQAHDLDEILGRVRSALISLQAGSARGAQEDGQ